MSGRSHLCVWWSWVGSQAGRVGLQDGASPPDEAQHDLGEDALDPSPLTTSV
jgi:hypothetical protein